MWDIYFGMPSGLTWRCKCFSTCESPVRWSRQSKMEACLQFYKGAEERACERYPVRHPTAGSPIRWRTKHPPKAGILFLSKRKRRLRRYLLDWLTFFKPLLHKFPVHNPPPSLYVICAHIFIIQIIRVLPNI